jgi:hypothetical protein
MNESIIALIGSLTGLLGLGVTFYSKYRDSNIKDKELELKKEQFDLEKKHQISKEIYQKLFEKKIFVYKNLYDELLKYKKRLLDIGKEYYDIDSQGDTIFSKVTAENVNISSLQDIFSIIEKNIFLISPKIEKIYTDLSRIYREKENEFEFMLNNDISSEREAEDESNRLDKKFFEEHQNKITELFKQIEYEIKEMKNKIGFI